MSPVEQFVDECCAFDSHTIASSGEVYAAYQRWALQTQQSRLLPRRTFITALRSILGPVTRSGDNVYGTHRRNDARVRGFRGVRTS